MAKKKPTELSRLLPRLPEPPRIPGGEAAGLVFESRPLAGPEIEIPANEDEDRLARFEAWAAQTGGSLPEFVVWEFLVYKKRLVEGQEVTFQYPFFGGRTAFGGFVADFALILRREIWRVMGERWHLLQPQDRARDKIAKAILESRGWRVLDLYEDDLLTRADYVLSLAWERSAEVEKV